MENIIIYDLNKNKVGQLTIADEVSNTEYKPALIKDTIVAYQAGLRQGTRATKNTSKVSGSTRKLYKQKGTGRARAGSVKGVQRRHGATQFGPQPQTFYLKTNKKAAKLALRSLFAESLRQNKITIIDYFKLDNSKSKSIKQIITNWQSTNLLIVDAELEDQNFLQASRNFSNIKILPLSALNTYDLMKYHQVWLSKLAAETLLSDLVK